MNRYTQIQEEYIQEHNIVLCPKGQSTCWSRTHVHVKERKLCKWEQRNSITSTFTLLHEIGHCETYSTTMRRVESEYYATQWAADECRKLKLDVPEKIRKKYQDYIDRELDRGQRRGGSHYQSSYNINWDKQVFGDCYFFQVSDDAIGIEMIDREERILMKDADVVYNGFGDIEYIDCINERFYPAEDCRKIQ